MPLVLTLPPACPPFVKARCEELRYHGTHWKQAESQDHKVAMELKIGTLRERSRQCVADAQSCGRPDGNFPQDDGGVGAGPASKGTTHNEEEAQQSEVIWYLRNVVAEKKWAQ